jgi:hypothetical protein
MNFHNTIPRTSNMVSEQTQISIAVSLYQYRSDNGFWALLPTSIPTQQVPQMVLIGNGNREIRSSPTGSFKLMKITNSFFGTHQLEVGNYTELLIQ